MGGTRAVREEPGKQKPRNAAFASRLRDCGRGNSPEAAPKQMRGRKGKMYRVSSFGCGERQATYTTYRRGQELPFLNASWLNVGVK